MMITTIAHTTTNMNPPARIASTVQKQRDLKHQQREALAIEAITLAKTNVQDALDYM